MEHVSPLPRLVVTGASGFVGRRLLEMLQSSYRIEAVDRQSAAERGLALGPNVRWHQVELCEPAPVDRLLAELKASGGADYLIHLAAYYDFSGDDHPEYQRTNVDATRHLLEACRGLGLRRFVFASSVAACAFPKPGEAITELTPPLGDHRYAETKRLGEEMVHEANRHFPTAIVRFAALFSDWCEYGPLFHFLDTWLSESWNARILGGHGRSAVPYLHVRDLVLFLQRVLERGDRLEPAEILIASPDGAVSHRQLFDVATRYAYGEARRPLLVPKLLAIPGIWARCKFGHLIGHEPFERVWMGRYIDFSLTVDSHRSRERLDWAPRPRLEILRRLPFLIENWKADPAEWYRRNLDMARAARLRPNLLLYYLLERHEAAISERFTERLRAEADTPHYRDLPAEEHAWHHRLVLRNLLNAVRTRERAAFRTYCGDLAQRRAAQGFAESEVREALRLLREVTFEVLRRDPEAVPLRDAIREYVSVTIDFGIDAIEEVFEGLRAGVTLDPPPPVATSASEKAGSHA